jgi:hypothetical protein
MGEQMLERVIYVSQAASGTHPGDITAIVGAARETNARLEITGGLIFHEGWLVQVLEGPAMTVRDMWTRISRDPRHRNVVFRSRERALCRLFRGQAMALRTGTRLDPAVLHDFDYCSGFPVETFPADDLLEFMVRACRPHRGPGQLDSMRAVS